MEIGNLLHAPILNIHVKCRGDINLIWRRVQSAYPETFGNDVKIGIMFVDNIYKTEGKKISSCHKFLTTEFQEVDGEGLFS